MNATEILEQEIASALAGNEIYTSYQDSWQYLLESYLGGEEYRKAGHLTKYELESGKEYDARLRATPLENHCQSVVSVYNSFLFRESPEREFGTISPIPELDAFLRNCDMDGRNLDQFMKDVSTWSSVFGHCWILMAKPNLGLQTRAEELALGVRPYVNLLTPLVVTDWRYERTPMGGYELSYFKYVEDVNGSVKTIKEWTAQTIRTMVIDAKNKKFVSDVTEVNGLGKIPAICAYNGRGPVRGIGVSDITDIADAQKFIYNATSEVEQSIRMNTHPSLVKTPDTQAGIGAGSLIHMPDNLDPGLKPYLIEYTGASIASIYQAIGHAVESIDQMANTGAVRATVARTLSGVAMETEFQLLNARLSEKADLLEIAEESLWELFCQYQGYEWDGKIDYPDSFNIRDKQKELNELQVAKNTATDPRVLALIDHELVEFLGEDADILLPETVTLANGETVPYDSAEPFEEPEEMFNPVTGETGWVIDFQSKRDLMKQGWVEKE